MPLLSFNLYYQSSWKQEVFVCQCVLHTYRTKRQPLSPQLGTLMKQQKCWEGWEVAGWASPQEREGRSWPVRAEGGREGGREGGGERKKSATGEEGTAFVWHSKAVKGYADKVIGLGKKSLQWCPGCSPETQGGICHSWSKSCCTLEVWGCNAGSMPAKQPGHLLVVLGQSAWTPKSKKPGCKQWQFTIAGARWSAVAISVCLKNEKIKNLPSPPKIYSLSKVSVWQSWRLKSSHYLQTRCSMGGSRTSLSALMWQACL